MVMSSRNHSLLSMFSSPINLSGIDLQLCRARTEYKIFEKLIAMVPDILDRVIEGVESEDELAVIAESVCLIFVNMTLFNVL